MTVHPDRSRIHEGERTRLTVRLDQPTTRATKVHTTAGTVRIPAGERVAHLSFHAPQDRTDEKVEDVMVFDHTVIQVVDDDPRPVVSLRDAAVTASPLVPVSASFDVRLDRQRDRPMSIDVHTGRRTDPGRRAGPLDPRDRLPDGAGRHASRPGAPHPPASRRREGDPDGAATGADVRRGDARPLRPGRLAATRGGPAVLAVESPRSLTSTFGRSCR